MRQLFLCAAAALTACGSGADAPADMATANAVVPEPSVPTAETSVGSGRPSPAASESGASPAPLDPPAPGEPGGLDDDRSPVEETPQPEASA